MPLFKNINIITTITKRLTQWYSWRSSWQKIATVCASNPNVVGYDLINEPSTSTDKEHHWKDVDSVGVEQVLERYEQMVVGLSIYLSHDLIS